MSERKSWFYTVVGELANAAREIQPPRLRDETLAACQKAMDEYHGERAVIEAAKAALPDLRGFLNRHYEVFGTSFEHKFEPLVEATERLQELEGQND